MTKEEAIKAMLSGAKITHKYFKAHEWITMEGNNTILTEEGHAISTLLFWKYRQSESWEKGYSIWFYKNEKSNKM